MKNIIRYILLLAVSCLVGQLRGESRVLRSLTASDGLTDLTVNALYKDSLGFVWIGTGNSVERFDGVFLKHYALAGADERLKRVNVMTATAGHHLWMGNGQGLWHLNRQADAFEQVVPDVINSAVLSLLNDGKGTLYIGSERGLYVHRNGRFEHILLDPNAFSTANAVTSMTLGEGGRRLWMATLNGLYAMDLADGKMRRWHNEAGGEHYCSFNQLARVGDKLYLGTMDRGIICFDIRQEAFYPFINVGCNVISALSTDGGRMLYVGTDGNGVHFIDTERQEETFVMRHEAGSEGSLRSNSVYSLLVDREGVVWVGFYQAGLDYTLYQGNTFEVYAYPPYFDSKDIPVRALSINGGEKLIGSRDGLYYIHEDKGLFKVFGTPRMRSDMVFCIRRFEGKYWIGTYGGGLYVLDPLTLTLDDFSREEPFYKGHVFCLEEDREHALWIGTSMGVFRYKDGRMTARYTNANSSLPDGNVYEICFDSAGKGWICTENGLCLWDPSAHKLRTDVFPEGFFRKEKVREVYEDSAHTLYFFPDKGPLFISDLSMNRFRRLQPGTPLEGCDGMSIIEDSRGWLWMGTSKGLFHYDKRENFVLYNFMDGIPDPMFTLCPSVRDAEGNFWFGNSRGLIKLDVGRVGTKSGETYPLRVTDVLVNGLSPADTDEASVDDDGRLLRLDGAGRNITFCLSDFSYTAPAVMSYEYRLDGAEKAWQSLVGRSSVTYYSLPAGEYIFRVRRMGQPDTEVSMTVQVESGIGHWLVAGLCVLLVVSAAGWRYARLRRPVAAAPEAPVMAAAEDTPGADTPAEEKYRTFRVPADECERLVERLEELMRREQPYRHSDLKIADLATSIGTSPHTLSYVFNQHLKRNYYDYINDYRVEEFKRLVGEEASARYTLSALAERCGFSSRASFFRYFKKATGITPSEYISGLGKSSE